MCLINGKHTRDFTFIDDIVEGVIKTLDNTATTKMLIGKVIYLIQAS